MTVHKNSSVVLHYQDASGLFKAMPEKELNAENMHASIAYLRLQNTGKIAVGKVYFSAVSYTHLTLPTN